MKSARVIAKNIFMGDWSVVKDTHREKFRYIIKGYDEDLEPVQLPVFESVTGANRTSQVSFRVVNHSNLVYAVDSGMAYSRIESRLRSLFETLFSPEMIDATIGVADRRNADRLRSILKSIDSMEISELDRAKTISRRNGIRDNISYSDYGRVIDDLKERVKSVLKRNHRYEVKSFSFSENGNLELHMDFVYEYKNGYHMKQSRTPISLSINLDDFEDKFFIKSVSSFVKEAIKNLAETYPDGSEQLNSAIDSIRTGKRTGLNEMTFMYTDGIVSRRIFISIF